MAARVAPRRWFARRAARNAAAATLARPPSRAANTFGSPLPDVLRAGGWEAAWAEGITPWDSGGHVPVLDALLAPAGAGGGGGGGSPNGDPAAFSPAPLAAGPVLVPGAGAAYDAIAFARAGRAVTAVDIAPTAVAAARRVAEADAAGAAALAAGRLRLAQADFFALQPGAAWGVIFDHTFLCALPPDLWPAWADAVTRLVRPDGELVSVLFPIGDHAGGPPYALAPGTVRGLLEPRGWEETFLAPIPPGLSHKARAGREWLGRYRLRTDRYPAIRVPGKR
jgi:methyl halide transferase